MFTSGLCSSIFIPKQNRKYSENIHFTNGNLHHKFERYWIGDSVYTEVQLTLC